MPSHRHARYGPSDRYGPPPPAGMCLSVFAILRRGGKVAVGRPRPHRRWIEDWLPSFQAFDAGDLEGAWRDLRIPAAYLREGEHPDAALARVMREQLGVRRYEARPPRVVSYAAPSDWYPGHSHWDLAFVYDVRATLPTRTPRAWAEIGWRDPRALRPAEFGWNEDLARDLGVARAGGKPRSG